MDNQTLVIMWGVLGFLSFIFGVIVTHRWLLVADSDKIIAESADCRQVIELIKQQS